MTKIVEMLKEIGFPFAYDHFAEGEPDINPPFICYFTPNSNNFSADGTVYFAANRISIELYTDKKDLDVERRVENTLRKFGVCYEKSEVWIESERLYEVLYQFEMEE